MLSQLRIVKTTFSSGFTLIELLVATTIMLLLVGAGIAAFLDFNDRQILITNAKEFQSYLRTAQVRARAGDRPSTCATLEGYAVRLTTNSQTVNLYAVCANGDVLRDSYQLDSTIITSQAVNVTFLGLHGGVQGAGTVSLESINDPTLSYEFDVTSGGEITEGSLVEEAQ